MTQLKVWNGADASWWTPTDWLYAGTVKKKIKVGSNKNQAQEPHNNSLQSYTEYRHVHRVHPLSADPTMWYNATKNFQSLQSFAQAAELDRLICWRQLPPQIGLCVPLFFLQNMSNLLIFCFFKCLISFTQQCKIVKLKVSHLEDLFNFPYFWNLNDLLFFDLFPKITQVCVTFTQTCVLHTVSV